MPCRTEAVETFEAHNVLFLPSKAANAGGVAISGFEMTQNSLHSHWEAADLNLQLQNIMKQIHQKCLEYGESIEKTNYIKGANIAGFKKVADAMLAYGIL